jgi:hypothetical protein
MAYTWREELAWAAGFWDGEGCTSIHKQGNNATASVHQVDDEVESLYRFHNAVLGVGKIYGPYQAKKGNHQPYFSWHVSGGSKVQAVIAMLWPFLGNIKKEQAANVLKSASWRGEGMCQNNKHIINPDSQQLNRHTWRYIHYKCEECYREKLERRNKVRKAQRLIRKTAVI